MQLLYSINRTGTTILMVTHDREMVDKMRRRVIALEDGRIVARRAPRGVLLRMSRFKLLVSEALHSIRSNISTTVAAMMTVFIGMFLLGVCIALGSWMVSWSEPHQERRSSSTSTSARPRPARQPATQRRQAATLDRINQITRRA